MRVTPLRLATAGCLSVGLGLGVASGQSVNLNCTASTTGVAFGAYDSLAASPTNSTGTIPLSCTGNPESPKMVIVFLSSGGSGNTLARRMTSGGGGVLPYQLYTDAARTTVWGNGSNGSGDGRTMVAIPESGALTIYGRVPARQAASPGSYLDTLVVTVNF